MATEETKTSKTVTVGCKLPHGLRLDHEGHRVTLNGANSSRVIGGYGMTEVDGDFWEAWLSRHRDYPPVTAGLVFAQNTAKSAESQAKEQAQVATGFEPIDPNAPGGGVVPAE